MAGDTITVHEGIYRERINPHRGGASGQKRIAFRASPGEPILFQIGLMYFYGWIVITLHMIIKRCLMT